MIQNNLFKIFLIWLVKLYAVRLIDYLMLPTDVKNLSPQDLSTLVNLEWVQSYNPIFMTLYTSKALIKAGYKTTIKMASRNQATENIHPLTL